MNGKNYLFSVLFLLVLFSFGCNKEHIPSGNGTPVELPQDGEKVIASQNHFAFDFFKETLKKETSNDNILVSPLSVYLDFSMAYQGAAGNTAAEMRSALRMGDLSDELINNTNKSQMEGLTNVDTKVDLNIANAIWYRDQGALPLPSFLDVAKNSYLSEVTGADFKNDIVLDEVNGWVKDRTNGKVKKILDEVGPDDVMYLLNAVYFKGQWQKEFDKEETQKRDFNVNGEEKVEADFMHQKSNFLYYKDDKMQAVELPYSNGSFAMYVVKPAENNDLNTLVNDLDTDSWLQILSGMDSTTLKVYLPKWEYSYGIESMIPHMRDLGMHDAFEDNADFSKMYPSDFHVKISKAIHKSYIAVDEKGTEAAAVTAIVVGEMTSVTPPDFEVMDVNKPFLYVIAEKNTGTILFMGQVNNPLEG